MDKLNTGFITKKIEMPRIITPILQEPEKMADEEICRNNECENTSTENGNIKQIPVEIIKGIIIGIIVGLVLFKVIK